MRTEKAIYDHIYILSRDSEGLCAVNFLYVALMRRNIFLSCATIAGVVIHLNSVSLILM